MTHLEVPFPEITTEKFSRAWTRFELVAAKRNRILLKTWQFSQLYKEESFFNTSNLENDKVTLKVLKAALN